MQCEQHVSLKFFIVWIVFEEGGTVGKSANGFEMQGEHHISLK